MIGFNWGRRYSLGSGERAVTSSWCKTVLITWWFAVRYSLSVFMLIWILICSTALDTVHTVEAYMSFVRQQIDGNKRCFLLVVFLPLITELHRRIPIHSLKAERLERKCLSTISQDVGNVGYESSKWSYPHSNGKAAFNQYHLTEHGTTSQPIEATRKLSKLCWTLNQ